MELLLNLAWLLLAFPAYWLWCERRGTEKSGLQRLLSLACLLFILFPVISATDDLQAMRTELEESPTASKRTLRQTGNDKAPFSAGQSPAVATSKLTIFMGAEDWHPLSEVAVFLPMAPAIERSGRAPPLSSLA